MNTKNNENGVSLGNGKALEDTGKAILVQLYDEGKPRWIPQSVIHEDSDVYGIRSDSCEGNVVVMRWWAEEKGLI